MSFEENAKTLAIGVPMSIIFGAITATGQPNFQQTARFNSLAAWAAIFLFSMLHKYDFSSIRKSLGMQKRSGDD